MKPPSDTPPFCLEQGMLRVFRSLGWLAWPALACLALTVGAHAAWWLSDRAAWGLPLLGMAATLGWAAVAWFCARARCPFPGGFGHLFRLMTQSIGLRLPPAWALAIGGALLVVLLAVPWYPAAMLWPVLLMLLLGYPRFGKPAVYVLELVAGGFGLASILIAVYADEPQAWMRVLAAGWLIAGMAAVVVAVGLAVGRRWRALVNLVWLWPAVLPIALAWGSESLGLSLWTGFGLVVWPALLLVAALVSHKLALNACQELLANWELSQVIGRPAEAGGDGPVRDNNEHAKVCFPEYRHWLPEGTGETGYVTWIGGPNDKVIAEECVAFRTSSLADAPFCRTADPRGQSIAGLVARLIPDLGLAQVQPLREALEHSWTVRRLKPKQHALVKMPWDHPYLLAVPVEWQGSWRYPAGCGIHDVDDYPCFANKVDVQIRLRPELLAAVDRLADPPKTGDRHADDVRAAQALLWNAWRILPGVYETLLTCLVRQFRGLSVSLFTGGESAALSGAKREVLQALNAGLAASLPAPLGELVEVTVLNLDVDTYYAGDSRTQQHALRRQEHDQMFRLKDNLDRTWDEVVDLVLKGDPAPADGTSAEALRGQMSAVLADAEHRITAAVHKAVTAVGEMKQAKPAAPMYGEVHKALSTAEDAFLTQVTERFQRVQQALEDLNKAARTT